MIDQEIEQHIIEFFNDNFETLKLEGGHSLASYVKEMALNQVLMYWRRLHDVATRVTETEVKLSLPGQHTPRGRSFSIEGIVDIVKEADPELSRDRTVMYDIKTHDRESIEGNKTSYLGQLNIYAHIWQVLRKQCLDETAVICTSLPDEINRALQIRDERRLERALQRWNPIIEMPFDADQVESTVNDFGAVVDRIEDGEFGPPDIEVLRQHAPGTHVPFATHVCRNCDARFSCASYRQFMTSGRRTSDNQYRQYVLDDFGDDDERDEWRVAEMDHAAARTEMLNRLAKS